MRVVKALRGFGDDVSAHPRGQTNALRACRRDQHAEVGSFDVLHREDVPFGALVREVVHLDHVRVVEACGELRLVDEHRLEASRRAEARKDALDDDDLLGALGTTLLGDEDLRHAAFAEASLHLVLRELGGDGGVGHGMN